MNWQNCTMCVQDFAVLSTNITAELSKQEVDNFVRMCQIFSKHVPTFGDDCSLIPVTVMFNRSNDQMLNANDDTNLIYLIEREITASRSPAVLEMRQRAELEITSTLTQYVREFKPDLKLHPFGSTQFGTRFVYANFNLLIVNGEFT